MRVLISGAGIAGPTLAFFLARSGCARVTVVERTHALLPHGQNIDIQGSARTVIDRMGLMAEVRRHNTTEKGTQFIAPDGRPFVLFALNKAVSFTSELEILRGDLAKVLYEATKDHRDVRYLFNTTVKQVSDDGDDGPLQVQLSDGSTQEYDVVVAADGQWSKVRKQCFAAEDDVLKVIDKGLYAIYWTAPRSKQDNDYWNIYLAVPSRNVSIRPDPYGTVRACFTIMPRTDEQKNAWHEASKSFDRAQQQALLRREFADAGWQTQRMLDAVEKAPDFYFQAVQQIRMRRWHNKSGRVVCLGDAAFAPTPLTGMGTSLAITGAYVLAGELSKLVDGQHPRDAMVAYDKAFRTFVEEQQYIPSIIPGAAHPSTRWGGWLLQSCIWAGHKIVNLPWIAKRFTAPSVDGGQHQVDFVLPEYNKLATVSGGAGGGA